MYFSSLPATAMHVLASRTIWFLLNTWWAIIPTLLCKIAKWINLYSFFFPFCAHKALLKAGKICSNINSLPHYMTSLFLFLSWVCLWCVHTGLLFPLCFWKQPNELVVLKYFGGLYNHVWSLQIPSHPRKGKCIIGCFGGNPALV